MNLISQDEYWELLKDEHFLVSRPFMTVIDEGVLKNSQVKNRPDEYFLLKNFLSVLYTVGVQTGKLSVKDFISIISTRPAKLFGLYPKKGMLRPGADADIVIWDPAHERNLYCNLPAEQGMKQVSYKLLGRCEFVFARGQMAYNGESYYTESLSGHFLPP